MFSFVHRGSGETAHVTGGPVAGVSLRSLVATQRSCLGPLTGESEGQTSHVKDT